MTTDEIVDMTAVIIGDWKQLHNGDVQLNYMGVNCEFTPAYTTISGNSIWWWVDYNGESYYWANDKLVYTDVEAKLMCIKYAKRLLDERNRNPNTSAADGLGM